MLYIKQIKLCKGKDFITIHNIIFNPETKHISKRTLHEFSMLLTTSHGYLIFKTLQARAYVGKYYYNHARTIQMNVTTIIEQVHQKYDYTSKTIVCLHFICNNFALYVHFSTKHSINMFIEAVASIHLLFPLFKRYHNRMKFTHSAKRHILHQIEQDFSNEHIHCVSNYKAYQYIRLAMKRKIKKSLIITILSIKNSNIFDEKLFINEIGNLFKNEKTLSNSENKRRPSKRM